MKLLHFLMRSEVEEEVERIEVEMKHDLMLIRPEWYEKIYPVEADPAGSDSGYGWAIPQNEQEVRQMMLGIKKLGIIPER